MVAPYWSDNDIRKEGVVRYVAIEKSRSVEGDSMLTNISLHLQQKGYIDFEGSFAIIAQWDHVHPFPHGSPSGFNITEDELKKVTNCLIIMPRK